MTKYIIRNEEIMVSPVSCSKAEALQESIGLWRQVAKLIRNDESTFVSDVSSDVDPLCVKYYDNGSCDGCPVKEKTKKSCCEDAPAGDYLFEVGNYGDREAAIKAANAHVKFLKSLVK